MAFALKRKLKYQGRSLRVNNAPGLPRIFATLAQSQLSGFCGESLVNHANCKLLTKLARKLNGLAC
jgi:hypothetical protein